MTTQGDAVRPTSVYRTANGVLQSWAKPNGFVKLKGACHWEKVLPGFRLLLWLQCNKWGWDRATGSTFTVNFELTHLASGRILRERFRELLDDADGVAFARISRRVRAKFEEDDASLPEEVHWSASNDIWLPFYDVADVDAWCSDFLLPRFPRMLDALTKGGSRRLPATTLELEIPGLGLSKNEDGTCVAVPRESLDELGALLRSLNVGEGRGDPAALKADDLVLLVTLRDRRRGSPPTLPAEVGFTGILRADWDLGVTTRQSLLDILAIAEVGSTTVIHERVGLVEIDSKVRLKVV